MTKLKHIGVKGEGYFCIVKKYQKEDTAEYFAVKELKKEHYSNDDYRYRLNREINLLEQLQGSENIIELIKSGHNKEKEKIWYLMPFADCNLYNYIKKEHGKLVEKDKYDLIDQILSAIKHAHDLSILHRDISPNNVLVFNNKDEVNLRVSDFGLGKDTESLSYYSGSSVNGYGQILYVSPEQRIKLKDASVRSDIFSLGKLIYFVFTAKDPDNIKFFELSSLVTKATEENPDDRHQNIDELIEHFEALKELIFNKEIDIERLTLIEVVEAEQTFSWVELHGLLVQGNYSDHVWSDYINPVNNLLLNGSNLKLYYAEVGNSIRDFLKTYIDKLHECYKTVKWPFSDMNRFASLLIAIIKEIPDDQSRLLAFKELWVIAYENDQWGAQSEVKSVFNDEYITKNIEIQLAEAIIKSETEVDLKLFKGLRLPQRIKFSIIRGNALSKENKLKRKEEYSTEEFDF